MPFSPSRSSARFRRVTEGVQVRDLGDEMVLHVEATDTWHSLDAASTTVLRAADGATNVTAIVAATGLPADTVDVVVAELVERGLVTVPAGMDRRALLRRGALLGSAAVVGPGILSLVAPAPMAAASPGDPGERVSIQSTTAPGAYVTRAAGANTALTMRLVTAQDSADLRARATFAVVNGLDDRGNVSFQSVDATTNAVIVNQYIRHAGFVLFNGTSDGSAGFRGDATFNLAPSFSSSGRAIRSANFPNAYAARGGDTAGSAVFLTDNAGGFGQPNASNENRSFNLVAPLFV
jgi:tRNA threonylcarbamoyladenosine modification (KEOPS) complex  Pcc1 subunit